MSGVLILFYIQLNFVIFITLSSLHLHIFVKSESVVHNYNSFMHPRSSSYSLLCDTEGTHHD